MESLRPFLDDLAFWHWWIFGIILLTLEMLVPGTFFLWMGVAATLVGLAVLAIPDLGWQYQWMGFGILSVGAIVAWRVYASKHPVESDQPNLNRKTAQYVGRRITLSDAIVDGRGRAKVDDSVWMLETADGGDVTAGSQVEIVDGRDSTLIVKSTD